MSNQIQSQPQNQTTAPLQNSTVVNNISSQPQPPSFLQKKGLLGGKQGNMGSIVSPTDNVLSPCSAKLSSSKQRHFAKGKPAGISSQLSKLASSGNNSTPSDKSKVDF